MKRPPFLVPLTAGLAALALAATVAPSVAAPPTRGVDLSPLGTYRDGAFEVSAAEISAHDPGTQRLFVVNADPADPGVDVLDISDPSTPVLVEAVRGLGGNPNSVAVADGIVAVAVENPVKDAAGWVALLDTDGSELNRVVVGALPDMLTFTPNGRALVVANEGEPAAGLEGDGDPYDADRDPVGSVSVVDLSKGVAKASVRTAGFESYNAKRGQLVADGVRLNSQVPTVAQDLEPEYVTVGHDSRTAWVTLQEANAIAEIDLVRARVSDVFGLGQKDHSVSGNGLDRSDENGAAIATVENLYGVRMPDAVSSVRSGGTTYLLTANEGDARAYTGLTDESRVRDLRDLTGAEERYEALCEAEFPDREDLIARSELGRLTVSTIDGYDAGRNCYSSLHAFGGRSFSVFTTDGELVFDSADDFEQATLAALPEFFNSDHAEAEFDNRSDNKGPEPEGITVERLFGRVIAFIGLERIGGVMSYDVTDPRRPVFVDYVNNRDFAAQAAGQENVEDFVPGAESGDLGPEGLIVIKAESSPTGDPLLVVTNEVSGTTTLFDVQKSSRK